MTEYSCPGISMPQPPDAPYEGYVACYRAGHVCPPHVPHTTDRDGYRDTTYRCPCCGDSGFSYGRPIEWDEVES
jgi:hypothetical protein